MTDAAPALKKSKAAGGWGALRSCGKHLLASGSALAGAKAMLKANQPDGFDCPGCAWGDPEHGSSFEFCENGVKAVAWESTERRATPAFFARHTVSELRGWSDYDLENVGRLTHPMRYDAATDRYVAVDWADAFAEIGAELRKLNSPNEAEFYTSGRASNEAAFLYQLFARSFGTNNFPDCSNMCHEASGVGLIASIGIGKGTVLLEDFHHADAIFVIGQNPATNHPRMLGDLRKASMRGARVAVLNPIRERGLEKFADPQDKIEMLRGGATSIATHYFQPKLGGDMAAIRGVAKIVFARDDLEKAAGRPSLLDEEFIARHTHGIETWRAEVIATPWGHIEDQSGLTYDEIETLADVYLGAERVIATWAMGVTQHKHSVATVREIANLLFLRGHVGREGAGLCPVRGHSNVQGDRTVGINENAPGWFLDNLDKEFGIASPRTPGHNVLHAIHAMVEGRSKAFIGLGGNFARATPDTPVVEAALRACRLTVQIATKPNLGHMAVGEVAYLLPCLGRTEIERNSKGKVQIVTVEDSMSMVHGSGGINKPASPHLKSEVAIIAGMAAEAVGSQVIDWAAMADDNDLIRDRLSRVIPGFEDYNVRVRKPRGFWLRNSATEREWRTPSGRAEFSAAPLPVEVEHQSARKTEGQFVLQTFRSHDQYNTTVYGLDDRYRGVYGERRVVFINPQDIAAMGAEPNARVDVLGSSEDGRARVAEDFRIVAYDIPRGCVAGYYPELNAVVPFNKAGEGSDTPLSKSTLVTFRQRSGA
ncbi:FdhF/YdeP family oxidoreductase [Chenggangzhangella methanolivorans]|uniref:FdhF/YdeP family oxidoreductase n=1 Tax=Chenggangzhangella methanolivorans TaxID=1437009 RepID=A0A9E6RBM5_9HYPH|nr:FdhF/YdeP family oxidoreductase [Chenggangzhangella methanolivorans]QZO01375.1 FdhF/YdeP family oxidoreductase [Chenggangzhangella methanolivorans]